MTSRKTDQDRTQRLARQIIEECRIAEEERQAEALKELAEIYSRIEFIEAPAPPEQDDDWHECWPAYETCPDCMNDYNWCTCTAFYTDIFDEEDDTRWLCYNHYHHGANFARFTDPQCPLCQLIGEPQ